MAFHHIRPCNNCLVIYALECVGSCTSRTLHFPSSSHTQLNFWIVGNLVFLCSVKACLLTDSALNPEASLWVYVARIRSLLHIAVAQTLGGKACFLSHWGQTWRTFFHSIFITPRLLLTILIKQIGLGKAFNQEPGASSCAGVCPPWPRAFLPVSVLALGTWTLWWHPLCPLCLTCAWPTVPVWVVPIPVVQFYLIHVASGTKTKEMYVPVYAQLCVCMHVCFYVSMCMCACVCDCMQVSVCMCICLYMFLWSVCVSVCVYMSLCAGVCVSICMFLHTCVCLNICLCICGWMSVWMSPCLYVHLCISLCICVCVYMCICIHVCIRVCTHTCVHTCASLCTCFFLVCFSIAVIKQKIPGPKWLQDKRFFSA